MTANCQIIDHKAKTFTKPMISIIILNYNGMKFVGKCLESVLNSLYSDFEIILVDNASSDGSIKYVKDKFRSNRKLRLVVNDKNYGFALGNNIGARNANGKYLVFLNIDTIVDSDWLTELVEVMDTNPSIGAAQCKLLLMDNPKLIDSAGHDIDWFGMAYVKGHTEENQGQYDRINEVFGATGAALMVRTDVFKKLGGFDEDFFMLFEEDDLCWRIWIAGYKVLYIPKAIVFHKSGGIRSEKGNYKNLYFSRRNRIMSLLKNYNTKNLIRFLPINVSLLFGIMFFTKDKLEYLRAYIKSSVWIILNAKKIAQKRRLTQGMRVVPDEQLIKMGILRKPNVMEILKKGY
jgi:GT2 family glycosyltransferase